MHSDRNLFDAIMGVGFGGFLFYRGLGRWRFMRGIENTPTSKVSAVAMGEAELSGTVRPINLLKAPFSGRDCVYYRYTVEEPHKRGWRTIDHGAQSAIFQLDDGTGQILVNPMGAQYEGDASFQMITNGWSGAAEPGVVNWLAARQSKSFLGTFSTMTRHRFTEFALCANQNVLVSGYVKTARRIVNGKEREENIVVAPETGTFLLSAYSEERLISRLRWTAPLQVFGGMGLLLACLWYVVNQYH
jgi:hypothetical protein